GALVAVVGDAVVIAVVVGAAVGLRVLRRHAGHVGARVEVIEHAVAVRVALRAAVILAGHAYDVAALARAAVLLVDDAVLVDVGFVVLGPIDEPADAAEDAEERRAEALVEPGAAAERDDDGRASRGVLHSAVDLGRVRARRGGEVRAAESLDEDPELLRDPHA